MANATVTWTVPDDYKGEAFARVHYETEGLSFDLPVHLLVPNKGWIWPTMSSKHSELKDLVFTIKNIESIDRKIIKIESNIPGYKVKFDSNSNIHFISIPDFYYKNQTSSIYKLFLKDSDHFDLEIPINIFPNN